MDSTPKETQSQNGWIKATDKMPEKDGRYLVIEKAPYKWIGVASMRRGKFDVEITYWQELPKGIEDKP